MGQEGRAVLALKPGNGGVQHHVAAEVAAEEQAVGGVGDNRFPVLRGHALPYPVPKKVAVGGEAAEDE